MRTLLLATILSMLLLCSQSAHSQAATGTEQAAPTGKVYFIRHTGHDGSAVTFKAVIDKEVVCKLSNKRHSVHDVAPGEHQFAVQFSGKQSEPVTLSIEGGKTYYLYMVLQPGVMKTALYCIEITANAAKPFLESGQQDTACQ